MLGMNVFFRFLIMATPTVVIIIVVKITMKAISGKAGAIDTRYAIAALDR
jgi:hypothetical protein